MIDVEKDLSDAKKKLSQLQNKKIEVATKLAALEDEKKKIVEDSNALGVNPKEIDKFITDLEAHIAAELLKVKEVLGSFGAV